MGKGRAKHSDPLDFQTEIKCHRVQTVSAAAGCWWAAPGAPASLHRTWLSHIALRSMRNRVSQPSMACLVRNPIQITWNNRKEKPLPTSLWLPADKEGSSGDTALGMAPQGHRTAEVVRYISVALMTCCREQSHSSGQTARCGPHTVRGSCHLQCSAHMYFWRDLWLNTYHKDLHTYPLSGLSSRLCWAQQLSTHCLPHGHGLRIPTMDIYLGCFHLFLFLAAYKTVLQHLSM